jgi:hypothetical protein
MHLSLLDGTGIHGQAQGLAVAEYRSPGDRQYHISLQAQKPYTATEETSGVGFAGADGFNGPVFGYSRNRTGGKQFSQKFHSLSWCRNFATHPRFQMCHPCVLPYFAIIVNAHIGGMPAQLLHGPVDHPFVLPAAVRLAQLKLLQGLTIAGVISGSANLSCRGRYLNFSLVDA